MELVKPDVGTIYACTTSEIPNVFVGIGKKQAYAYVGEMYTHPEFSDGVIRPTQRTTLVKIKRFWEFLEWKENNSGRY